MNLTKQQAITIFGTGTALARALGITKGAISQWPDALDQKQTAMVIGAAVQAGRPVPEGFIAPVVDLTSPPSEQAAA
ncbi:transcriptional repressor of cell division inhibition gene dicB [Pararobbsia alpina]|uniref:Cro/CI family transcriptional regulator n=1 Tax=Pararobbsia alpina TaxID=621374 RepID=UPI0039A5FC24